MQSLILIFGIVVTWVVVIIGEHIVKTSEKINPKNKKCTAIIIAIFGVAINILQIAPFVLPYILPTPDVSPLDYGAVHSAPAEIKMKAGGFFPVEIYYTTNGSDPASEDTDPSDVQKYTGPFYINESTSFTAASKLGTFWGPTTVPAPYIKVAKAEEEFVDVTGIEVSGPKEIMVETVAQLNASVSPDNATDKKVNWKSLTPKIASIDNSGVITAISNGTAIFEARSNSGEVAVEFPVEIVAPTPPQPTRHVSEGDINPPQRTTPTPEVVPTPIGCVFPTPTPEVLLPPAADPNVPVSFASINSSDTIVLDLGDTTWLTATYDPFNATNPVCNWSTDNQNIATVSPEGILYAAGVGSTFVNVSIGGVQDSKFVVVTEPLVYIDYVYIEEDYIDLYEYGDSYCPSIRIEPQNAFWDSITWYSINSGVASVDYDGEIFPHAAGHTTVYAEVHGANGYFQAPVEVYVNEDLTQDIDHAYFDEGAIELDAYGSSYYPQLVIEPEYAAIREIRWDSDDPDVAYVDSDGEIHPNEPGTTTIYARILGEHVIREAPLTVHVRESAPSAIGIDFVTIWDDVICLDAYGSSCYPSLSIFPSNAMVFEIVWSSDNPDVATVDYDGEIHAHEPGVATVWAEVSSINGSFGASVRVEVIEV